MKPEQTIVECRKMFDRISPRAPRTLTALEEWMGGYGSGGGNGRSTGISRPTERQALTALDRTAKGQPRDQAAQDHAQISEDLNMIFLALKRLDATIDRNQVLPAGVVQPEDGCEPCSRVTIAGRPHEASWQPIYVRIERPDNPDGAKLPLCSFHHEFYGRYGIFPNAAINEWHLGHLGARIPYLLIRDHHPDEFAMAQSKQRGRLLGRQNLGLQESA